MAALTVQTVDRAGFDLLAGDTACAGGGDYFANTGAEFIYINNASVGSITLTIAFASTATVDGQSATNRTVVLSASEEDLIGPFPTHLYNDANGRVQLTYSGVTSLTIAILKLTTS